MKADYSLAYYIPSSCLLVLFMCLVSVQNHASTVTQTQREYDVVSLVDDSMDAVQSKVCLIDDSVGPEFDGTFTMLDSIEQKWCTIASKVDVLIDTSSTIDVLVETVQSCVDVLDSKVDIVAGDTSEIHIDDFGGTWTIIEEVQDVICSKFDTLFANLSAIDQLIDTFSQDQQEAFLGTCTMIESITDTVELSHSAICELAVDTASYIDSTESLLDILLDKNITVCSRIDMLDIEVQENFIGTYTMLHALESKVELLEQSVDTLAILSTATVLEALEDKIYAISSQLEGIETVLLSTCDNLEVIESLIDPIEEKMLVVESSLDTLSEKVTSIDSEVSSIIDTIAIAESNVDVVLSSAPIIESKLCHIDSDIDIVLDTFSAIESKIDLTNNSILTIESKIDSIGVEADQSLDKVCFVESTIDIIDNALTTVESYLDILSTTESKVDEWDIAITEPLDKACTVESKVDVINSEFTDIIHQEITVDSKVDILCESVVAVQSSIDVLQQTAFTIESKVDIVDVQVASIHDKTCTIESTIDVVDSSVQVSQENIDRVESALCVLAGDFVETWTILDAIEMKVCTVDSLIDVIESKVEDIDGTVVPDSELNGTFTALDALQSKVCSSESVLDSIALHTEDITGTFTELAVLLNKSCTIESVIDSVTAEFTQSDSDLSNALDCLGVVITSTDIGTTGYTISTSGKYFLAEDVDYAASVAANSAITISATNVTLDLCDRTLRLSNAQASTPGIGVSASAGNVVIKNGTVREFTSDCFQLEDGISGVVLQDLRIIDSGDDGIDCLGTATNIMINRVLVTLCNGDGMSILHGADMMIQDSMFVNNTSNGIHITPSANEVAQRISILNCMCSTNTASGIVLDGSAGSVEEVAIDSCCTFSNGMDGITVDAASSTYIKNTIISANSADGIHMSGAASDVQVVHNVISSNGVEGVHVSDSSVENCAFQDNVFILNLSDNYREDNDAGTHTVLSNFALNATDSANYSTGTGIVTTINQALIDQGTGTFDTTPGKWRNISMTT